MSGHSKWATIKHKKAAADAKRGKVFTRLIREIQIAAREGDPDPEANPRLRTAVVAAKAQSMPANNIKRAILRGSGQLEGETLEEVTYEGYAPAGVAVFIEAVTDNRNRTVAELRHIFSKNGGNLGETGSVAWIFNKQSLIVVGRAETDEEQLMELVLGVGAEDLKEVGEHWEIYSSSEAHADVLAALQASGASIESASVTRIPSSTVKVDGKQAGSVIRMIEKLEEQDDVQDVFANFDIEESELEALAT